MMQLRTFQRIFLISFILSLRYIFYACADGGDIDAGGTHFQQQ